MLVSDKTDVWQHGSLIMLISDNTDIWHLSLGSPISWTLIWHYGSLTHNTVPGQHWFLTTRKVTALVAHTSLARLISHNSSHCNNNKQSMNIMFSNVISRSRNWSLTTLFRWQHLVTSNGSRTSVFWKNVVARNNTESFSNSGSKRWLVDKAENIQAGTFWALAVMNLKACSISNSREFLKIQNRTITGKLRILPILWSNKRPISLVDLLVVVKHLPYDIKLSFTPNGYVCRCEVSCLFF